MGFLSLVCGKNKFTPKWKRTNDLMGHKPRFDVICHWCGVPMFIRHSSVSPVVDEGEQTPDLVVNYMCYKCPQCAWFIRFDIRDTHEYLTKVYELRGNKEMVIPLDKWREDEEINRQLASFGYVCGR